MRDFTDLLKNVEKRHPVSFSPASKEDLNVFLESDLPDFILEFYRNHEPKCTADMEDIPDLRWLSINAIIGEVSSLEPSYTLNKHNYIPFISTSFGNIYVFNCNKVHDEYGPEVYFASHEMIVGGEERDYIESHIKFVANSLSEFMEKIVEGAFEK